MKNLLLALALLYSTLLSAQVNEEGIIKHQYIIMMKPGHDVNALLKEMPEVKVVECLSKRMNIWLLEAIDGKGSEQQLYKLQMSTHTKLAQHNHYVEPRSVVPNDPYFNVQWNMLNDGSITGGVAGADIQATDAWEINHENVTANGDSIVIAIIDNKFDLNHEDLNFFINYDEVPGNGIDDDGNGYIDDYRGWDVETNTDNVYASSGNHSTHTAGIAAAKGNNGLGVAGVCWGAKVMALRYGIEATESNVVAAYDYIREMRLLYNSSFGTKGAFVVVTNTSFGKDLGQPANYPIWCAMYDSLGAAGILSAGATANNNTNVDNLGDIPTACPSKWLISVTNTGRADQKQNAGFGKLSIDLGAPGQGVYSTIPGNYLALSGTSMSTPHVAGAIGAMYAAACKGLLDAYEEQPDSIALLVKQYILEGAEWTSAMNNITTTNGRLNLYRAIENLKRYNCDSCNYSIDIQKADITCLGDSNGALSVSVTGNINNYSYLWSTGATSIEVLNQPPGFYTVSVTDTSGCRRVWSEELHDPDSIRINTITVLPGNPSNIVISASSGNSPLEYSIDGSTYQSNALFAVTDTGLYTVYIRTVNGCTAQREVYVLPTGISTAADLQFSYNLYPNPAKDVLNIALEMPLATDLKISVHNVVGQTLYSNTKTTSAGLSNYSIDTQALADGVYYLSISHDRQILTKRFVVTH